MPLCMNTATTIKAASFLLAIQLFSSCIHPKYELNADEKKLKHTGRRGLGSEVSIYYDNAAIRRFKDNGTYTIKFESHMAVGDTASIRKAAINVAKQLLSIMNFKEHHKFIKVVISGTYGSYYGSTDYFYEVKMPMDDLSKAKFTHKYKGINVGPSAQRDNRSLHQTISSSEARAGSH
jgi:hypothetical protein